jgi:ATPase subunit of ABC transporter with duplicated ATPase domains
MNKVKLDKLAMLLMSPAPNINKFINKLPSNLNVTNRNKKIKEYFNYQGRWERALAKARKVIENRIKQGLPAFTPSPPRAAAGRPRAIVSKNSSKGGALSKMREKNHKKKEKKKSPRGMTLPSRQAPRPQIQIVNVPTTQGESNRLLAALVMRARPQGQHAVVYKRATMKNKR